MTPRFLVAIGLFAAILPQAAASDKQPYPHFDYDQAQKHAIQPHRREIPVEGATEGLNDVRMVLIVSPKGDVIDATGTDIFGTPGYWPQIESEVRAWKFLPFEVNGKPVTAEVQDAVTVLPAERTPVAYVAPPVVAPGSNVTIILSRSGCFGRCPQYTVTVSTEGIVFDGGVFVAAPGRQTDLVDADEVRKLAKQFIDADFYAMEPEYSARITDCPTFRLSIDIDGHTKDVVDYMGRRVGMPSSITELEKSVDRLARTDRWIRGTDGSSPH